MRRALVALVAGALLTGCGASRTGSVPSPTPSAGAAQSETADGVGEATDAADPADEETGPPAVGVGTHQRALGPRELEKGLLVEGDLPADFHQDPSFAQDTGAPRVTRGRAACGLVSQALSTSFRRGAPAIRLRGFTVGNRGPAVIEGVAAFPHGAQRALAALRSGFAQCAGYRVGSGKTSTTYVVEPYSVGPVGDGRAGVALTGSFPSVADYIVIRVVTVRVGAELVMLCTFGVLGNGISDDAYARIIRTAVRRVAHAH
jgi:hypothetical protein